MRLGSASFRGVTARRAFAVACRRSIAWFGEDAMRMLLTLVLVILAGLGVARAQDYPARAITMVVPYPPGGVTDTLARLLADRMKTILGQTIVIENVPGAGGSIGVGRIARGTPDGYTIAVG